MGNASQRIRKGSSDSGVAAQTVLKLHRKQLPRLTRPSDDDDDGWDENNHEKRFVFPLSIDFPMFQPN